MTKSLLGGGAAAALLSASLIFYADPSLAEPLTDSPQEPLTQQKSDGAANLADAETAQPTISDTSVLESKKDGGEEVKLSSLSLVPSDKPDSSAVVAPPKPFVATAYSLRGRTASGRFVKKGLIAADRRVLPLGTRVHVRAGSYSGEYLVADTGGAVRGRKIDIWMPSSREALRFGRQKVKLTILSPRPIRRAPHSRSTRSN